MKKQVFVINNQIKNFIQTYNNQLKNLYKTISDTDTEDTYLVLLYEDLAKKLKDKDKFINDYIAFAEEWNLPYVFYPYYGSFNKVILKASKGLTHPVFEATITNRDSKVVDIVRQIAAGCIVINVNKFKKINFKFDTNYPTVFYLQDMVEKCYRAKLWCSNSWFLDIHNSWEYLTVDNMDMMFQINMKNFQDEQKKYFEANKDCKYKEATPFIEDLRKWFKGEEWLVETNTPTTNIPVQNSNVNISVPSNIAPTSNTIEVKADSSNKQASQSEKKEDKTSDLPNISIETFTNNNQKVLQLAKLAQLVDEEAK